MNGRRNLRRLPEPAATIWRRARDELKSALQERIPDFEGWALSGGTVLAAQFRHRRSTDIDLMVAPKTGLARLNPRYDPTFDAELRRIGAGTPEHRRDQVVIPFGTGKVDIFEAAPAIRSGDEAAAVEGRRERVLSNAQILAGKLAGRGLDNPTRDLFDVAVLAETDREALEVAVNSVADDTWSEIIGRWSAAAGHHRANAREVLRDVAPRWTEVADEPAGAAIERAMSARYTSLLVKWSDDVLLVQTRCGESESRTRRLETADDAELCSELERYGIDRYMDERTLDRSRDVFERIKAGRHSRQVVYGTP